MWNGERQNELIAELRQDWVHAAPEAQTWSELWALAAAAGRQVRADAGAQ